MGSPRTNNIIDKSGCIEDRVFVGAENGEITQVPGADLFYTVLKDIVSEIHQGSPSHDTLMESVAEDVEKFKKGYTVHNDADHGDEFDGCGFAEIIREAFIDLSQNADAIIEGLELSEEQAKKGHIIATAAGKLAVHESYFAIKGGELVKNAVEAGADLVTYRGDHTASTLTIDKLQGRTYDSADANSEETESKPTFNLDTNNVVARAIELGLGEEDAQEYAEISAEMISLATARVLSGGQITKADYVK